MTADTDVQIEIRVEAPPETVFSYFTDPEKYRLWMGRAELDPQPGGVYRVTVGGGHTTIGEFVEIEPPSRIVFTWCWEGSDQVPPGSTTVEVTLSADGDGTMVRLRHSGLEPAEQREQHHHGWIHFFSRLAVAGAGGDPGPDPMETGA